MPWKESTCMTQRHEFVLLANASGTNQSELCKRFGISRKTGYKWRARFQTDEAQALPDRPRRPKRSPRRTLACIEEQLLALRSEHPAWGGRKLRARLLALGQANVPPARAIPAILQRPQPIAREASAQHQSFRRLEHPEPTHPWQMDLK